MTNEEIRALAIECLKSAPICRNPSIISFDLEELSAYTAAVEAKERNKIAAWIQTQRNDIPATGEEFANTIKDSINE